MARTVYALLVGIDGYPSPVTPLNGCLNDISAMRAFLEDRVGSGTDRLELRVLLNEQATRKSIIDGFRMHLSRGVKGDVALFYYSGHGSQAPTAEEFWHLEPDRLDETLVCYDSRLSGNFDLADKEISQLIAEVAGHEPHIVVILDSCHSGSATRAAEPAGLRRVPTDTRRRPASSYLVTPDEAASTIIGMRSATATPSKWVRLPRGSHVLLAACQADEEAKELASAGQVRGVFSLTLLQTLGYASSGTTYRDLFATVNARVRARVARQSPLIEATDISDLDRPFLGGAIQPRKSYFTVRRDPKYGWMVDGGAVHGIAPAAGPETTHFGLFLSSATEFDDLQTAVGEARVTRQTPANSEVSVALKDGTDPGTQESYRAIITAMPLPSLSVSIEGNADGSALVRSALAQAGPQRKPSLLLNEVPKDGELRLLVNDEAFQIRRDGDERFLAVEVKGISAESAGTVVRRLEHIARWRRVAELHNPSSRLPSEAVRLDLFLVASDGTEQPVDLASNGSELRLQYTPDGNEWRQPEFKIRLTNTTTQPLWCMLLDLTERYAVDPGLLVGGKLHLAAKEEAWAYNRDPIPAEVPDELWQQGLLDTRDLVKLIVTTDEPNPDAISQERLDVEYVRSGARNALAVRSTLDRLMERIATRELGARPESRDRLADWTTAEFSITTLRPREGVSVPDAGAAALLAPQVKVLGHPGLKAVVRLATTPIASRDAALPSLPAWFRDDPANVQPFSLASSRNVDGPLSVLELDDVVGVETVTPESPLRVEVGIPLGPDDHVLPVAYDPETRFYLPLGRARRTEGATEIIIERLPAPAASKRSLSGSIKIFFQKVVAAALGAEYNYPLLRAVDAQGLYTNDPELTRRRVEQSSRVLLYIHGIIGDTRDMAASAYRPKTVAIAPLAAAYDLVLAFDYENLNTSIEENGRLLKQRLAQVGLAPAHGKSLHVVAHSMGGLVARWFIEREGGNAVVQQLVMLGTPNAGSPWPKVQDWAMAALGLGVNALTSIAWPAKVLGALLVAIEKADVTLDQLAPGSPFLASLALSADPGIPYTIIAGDTSLVPAALEAQTGEVGDRVRRLFEKLNLRRVLHATASLAFLL